MDKQWEQEAIQRGRDFMMSVCGSPEEQGYESDQDKKLPQPPLCKAPTADSFLDLPRDFGALDLEKNFFQTLMSRESSRNYTQEAMSLAQLSFLLYMSQGIKEISPNGYATWRTVPCGGARHPFETYLLVQKVSGLEAGAYHYLPMTHQLEMLEAMPAEETAPLMVRTMFGQGWTARSNVIFYWSFMPYRAEWRYGPFAHKINLVDLGHVGENLYLACAALGLGTCGIGYYNQKLCDEVFRLDGEEEFTVYTQSVGTIKPEDWKKQDFIRFVKELKL